MIRDVNEIKELADNILDAEAWPIQTGNVRVIDGAFDGWLIFFNDYCKSNGLVRDPEFIDDLKIDYANDTDLNHYCEKCESVCDLHEEVERDPYGTGDSPDFVAVVSDCCRGPVVNAIGEKYSNHRLLEKLR